MAKKLLVPVLPSEHFYDAVVAAADLIAAERGLITFLFTTERRPPNPQDDNAADGTASDDDAAIDSGEVDSADIDAWREQQIAALEDARQILREHGVLGDRINYGFADYADNESSAQAIADEAAAGGYDIVMLARGYLIDEVEAQGSTPEEIMEAIKESVGDEVKVQVV